MPVDIDSISFVVRGKNRRDVLSVLGKHALLRQSDVAKHTNMYLTHARRTLIELEKEKLVKCLNSNATQGKLYQITSKGKMVAKELDKMYGLK